MSTYRVTAAIVVGAVLVLLLWYSSGLSNHCFSMGVSSPSSDELGLNNFTLTATHRKLLRAFGYVQFCQNCTLIPRCSCAIANVRSKDQVKEPNRIWGDKCTKSDILINQGPTAPLPSGIPTYTVEIMNVCVTGCNISRIHLNCGWFSSANLINPKVFKRLRYGDCLVNDGKPLINGGTIYFQYANTYLYPLSVSSVFCS